MDAFMSVGGVMDLGRQQVAAFMTDTANTFGKMWKNVKNKPKDLEELAKLEAEIMAKAQEETAKKFGDMYVGWIDEAENFLVGLTDAFANFDWETLFSGTKELEKGEQLTGVMGMFQRVFERLKDMDWGRIWGSLEKGFTKLWRYMEPWLEKQWTNLKTIVVGAVEEWADEAYRWFQSNWPTIAANIGELLVKGMLAAIVGLAVIAYEMDKAWKRIMIDSLHTVVQKLWAYLGQVWEGLKYVFTDGWDQMIADISAKVEEWGLQGISDSVIDGVKEAWDGLVDWIVGWGDRMLTAVTSPFDSMKEKFKSVTEVAKGGLTGVWDTAVDIFGNSVNTVLDRDWET